MSSHLVKEIYAGLLYCEKCKLILKPYDLRTVGSTNPAYNITICSNNPHILSDAYNPRILPVLEWYEKTNIPTLEELLIDE